MSDLDDLRAGQDRDTRLVGVPMFVVLRDETGAWGGAPAATTAATGASGVGGAAAAQSRAPHALGDGSRLAARLDALRASLAPSQRDGDLGLVASMLALAAHLDFGPGRSAR